MAANSGGVTGGSVDWSAIIKPFVTYSVGSLSKNEVISLIRAIVESEKDFVETVSQSNPYYVFYDVVTVLSAHVITAATNTDLLPRSSFPVACQAAKILCESFLSRFTHILKTSHPILNLKTYINSIQEFCSGTLILAQDEFSYILALLKSQDLPTKIQSTSPSTWDKEGTASAVKEIRRSRLDPSVLLYDQIALPVLSFPHDKPLNKLFSNEVLQIFQSIRAGQTFVELCLSLPHLKNFCPESISLMADAVQLIYSKNASSKNPSIDISALSEEMKLVYKLLSMPLQSMLTSADIHRLNQLAVAVGNVSFALIQYFYPTPPKDTQAVGPLNESEYEIGIWIISEVVWTQRKILSIFKDNSGLPQWVWLNYNLTQSRILFLNFHSYMSFVSQVEPLKTSDGKEKGKKISLIAVQQVWNEMLTAMTTHAIDMLQSLLHPYAPMTDSKITGSRLSNFKIDYQISNSDRIKIFFDGLNFIEILIQIATLSYRKSCRLKLAKYFSSQAKKENLNETFEAAETSLELSSNMFSEDENNGNSSRVVTVEPSGFGEQDNIDLEIEDENDNHSVSDLMTTEDEDEPDDEDDEDGDEAVARGIRNSEGKAGEAESASNQTENDDEPILGKWFESVLSVENHEKAELSFGADHIGKKSPVLDSNKSEENIFNLFQEIFVHDRESPLGFMNSALKVVSLLTRDIIANSNPILQKIAKMNCNEQILTLLAIVLKDLDLEKSSTEIGAISTIFDEDLNLLFIQFSSELAKLVQNMIAQNFLSGNLTTFFLEQLTIDLNGTGRWPLGLFPRSLAVMVQILLLKSENKETFVVSILKRVLDTLAENCLSPEVPPGYADLPVEHVQTLVFLFHTLSLMQKKAIMIETSTTIINVSKAPKGSLTQSHQLLSLGRLLLIFDYFIRQLYEPGINLVNQIQYNLFGEDTSGSYSPKLSKTSKDDTSEAQNTSVDPPSSKPLPPARLFCECLPVESSFECEASGSGPKFYNLIGTEVNYQENPRLDGLAMNFLMNKNDANLKEKNEYSEVIEAILALYDLPFPLERGEKGNEVLDSSWYYVEYFLIRLLFGLPPPHEFLERLEESEPSEFLTRPATVLYLITWIPRIQNRVFTSWIRDIFSKQGLLIAQAEELVNKANSWGYKFSGKFLEYSSLWLNSGNVGKNDSPVYYYAIEAALNYGLFGLKYDDGISCEGILIDILSSLQRLLTLELLRNTAGGATEKREKSAIYLLSIASSYLMQNVMGSVIGKNIDPNLKRELDELIQNEQEFHHFPEINGSKFKSDNIPGESYLLAVINGHMKCKKGKFKVNLTHLITSTVKVIGKDQNMRTLLYALLLDKSTESIGEFIGSMIEPDVYKKVDSPLNDELVAILGLKVLHVITSPDLRGIIKEDGDSAFIEESLQALVTILSQKENFHSIFSKILLENSGTLFLRMIDMVIETKSEGVLAKSFELLTLIFSQTGPPESMRSFLQLLLQYEEKLEMIPKQTFSPTFFRSVRVVSSVCKFISSLTNHLVKFDEERKVSGSIVPKILSLTIQETKKNVDINETFFWESFVHILPHLIDMAGICDVPQGHALLFREMTEWLKNFTENMDWEGCLRTKGSLKGEEDPKLSSLLIIMDYILDVGRGLKTAAGGQFSHSRDREATPGTSTPPNEPEEANFDLCESEIIEEGGGVDEEDSGGDDSDEETMKTSLCTYTVTRKEFMSQHWYHCHTCGMVDGVGVCSVCARVCHKNHDVTYAKFGSFFCDCGAKGDGVCLALDKPQVSAMAEKSYLGNNQTSFPACNSDGANNVNRRSSSPSMDNNKNGESSSGLAESANIGSVTIYGKSFTYEELLGSFKDFTLKLPLATLAKLKVAVYHLNNLKTPIGAFLRVQEALKCLRNGKDSQFEFNVSETLLSSTLNSQEGAFENIKMTYNGDQGSTIRQLINTFVIRRSTIAALSGPNARRHFLAVSQEKGKLTFLQMSSLFTGSDNGKKKLTLPKLASLTLPFTALTMASNSIRDDVLAICGLKDCHILVIGSNGTISTHLVLPAYHYSQNHIIKPVWLPGSQTELALLTADGVKIYDLAIDLAPTYHFLLPAGKVRDATFIFQDGCYHIAIMANDGRIYHEKLDETTSAKHGQYYIVNDLNYDDKELSKTQEIGNSEAKPVSLYYSHPLKLLFYTYPNGKSYVGTLDSLNSLKPPLTKTYLITPKGKPPVSLGLYQWIELPEHPGVIFAMGANSNAYVILLTESGCEIQEVKGHGPKLKCTDIAAIRFQHAPGKIKTSLLTLCDDGSLRVYETTEITEFWLNPRLRPIQESVMFARLSKRTTVHKKAPRPVRQNGSQITFPTDYFEYCQPLNEVEFGGNDLLQIYNVNQLKNRLNNPGMYVVSTKSTGFNLEVSINDANLVMTGIRVFLGSQDVTRVPSFIQVFGRSITVTLSRARWYDIPLLREESVQADQKLTITFGPSADLQSVTFVDSIKIYGKNKDAFGWPDENDEAPQVASQNAPPLNTELDRKDDGAVMEKIVINTLEMCELGVNMSGRDSKDLEQTLKLATEIFLENYQAFNNPTRNLMMSVIQTKSAYYEHRDKAVYSLCVKGIMKMNSLPDKEVDPELFSHIVNCVKNIAVVRPQHISHYDYQDIGYGPMNAVIVIENLCKIFERLVEIKPKNHYVVPLDCPGIQRVELVAMGVAEIIYSVMSSDINLVPSLSRPLIQLLLSKNNQISVHVRTVVVKRLRPKQARKRKVTFPGPSSPHCTTPDTAVDSPREREPPPSQSRGNQDDSNIPLVEVDEPIVMIGEPENEGQMPMIHPLEAFMGEEGFAMAPGMDLHSDAEDEAMVELAIALSLQEQAGGAALAIQGIQEGLQALEDMHQEVLNVAEAMSPPEEEVDHQHHASGEGGESDATASPPPSDDEGSTAATEGSNLRNSEPGGSDSSGSSNAGANSSERASKHQSDSTSLNADGEIGNAGASTMKENSSDKEKYSAIVGLMSGKPFRLALMRAIADEVSRTAYALRVIPLLQVLLVILSELDGTSEEELFVVKNMVTKLLPQMKLKELSQTAEWERNDTTEMTLIVMRMLSILVSRWRGTDSKSENMWIARITSETVHEADVINYCKDLLHLLRSTWRGQAMSDSMNSQLPSVLGASQLDVKTTVLKAHSGQSPPDYTPFFLKGYVKTHSKDLLEELPLLLSEMALRLPYQVKKVLSQTALFDEEWEELLCEILQNRNAPFVRRQARKLLLNIAGNRDHYHLIRDLYNIKYHLIHFKLLIGYNGNSDAERLAKCVKQEFKYTQLVAMVEHLNTCIDIATQRPTSWQTFCKSEDALQFIMLMSVYADESLTTAILTLLKIAVDGLPFDSKGESMMLKMSEDEKPFKSLAHCIIDSIEMRTFLEFVKKFLLEHPVVATRWQAHSLLLSFFQTCDMEHQVKLVRAMWDLWPFVPAAGSRASQFVDVLGFTTLNNDELRTNDLRTQVNLCISSIEAQGKTLLAHPNAIIYGSLVPFVSVDGFYLESESCEVCYNIDKPCATQKLSNIKSDAKFTANSQIVKLTSTLNILKLNVRLTEVKKVRMIKTLAVYYSPKSIPIVELKNKPNLWQMARKVQMGPSQTEVKLDFSVPITAANLMIEFLDFYENPQATTETLQCPRCSASVPSQPGVCTNCGENVYQCHKCRAINYDERDPFLCHSCGFCKYAKIDITVFAKTIVAVDPIENEEDHKKAETAVSNLLEKADQTYKQQQQMKGGLETMLQSIKEKRSMAGIATPLTLNVPTPIPASTGAVSATYAAAVANAINNNNGANSLGGNSIVANNGNLIGPAQAINAASAVTAATAGSTATSSLVLKNVQSLAYCYAIDCKNSYEELNRLMRKVAAYRKEMLKLDPTSYSLDTMNNVTFRRCYGCMASSITLSLRLLQALISAENMKGPFNLSFLSFLLRLSQSAGSTTLKEQVKNALCFFVKDDVLATSQLTQMINNRVMMALKKESWSDLSFETSEELSLLASLLQMYDSCWEIKLRSLMKILTHSIKRLRDSTMTETALLPCIKIIHSFIKATQAKDSKPTVLPFEGVSIDLEAWIRGDETSCFNSWKRKLPKIKSDETKEVQKEKGEEKGKGKVVKDRNRKFYLVKKYGRIWFEKFFKMNSNSTLKFKENNWMKQLIFCPGSVQTRTVTAALLKDLAQIPQRRLKIMELLTCFLEELPLFGESCREFMELYRDLATPAEFSAFLNAKGALNIVCKLLDEQIDNLNHLETITLHCDLSQGIAVWELARLLSVLAIPSVRRTKRVSLLSTVLGGYLALKRLRLHRTRPIEEAQEILLQLLEEITSGTEEETQIFMSVCVETLKKCPKEDLTTPVFVFERLCSLILHEENDVAEFYVSLDKDPQQEDFLQGRMLGNPYSSNDNGIGPLMRDIKNKICTDCELVALLEDDNGMELLVNNRIISLDLTLKEVYKRMWLPVNGQIEPMRIVYRMRGLLGDATEEFVESFAAPQDSHEDYETTFKMANVLIQCGGLHVILNTLDNLLYQQFVLSRCKPLLAVILKLLSYCSKIKKGRMALVEPSLNAVQTLLPILHLCLKHDLSCIQGSSGIVHLTDQVLEILDTILTGVGMLEKIDFSTFSDASGVPDDITQLLSLTDKLKGRPATMTNYLKVLACLTYTDKKKMGLIFDNYKDCWNFFKYDDDPSTEYAYKLEQVCTLISNVEAGPYGGSFKDFAIERGVLDTCLSYIRKRAPALKPPLGRPDSDEWKEMMSKSSLKYVLRLLAGFASNHVPSQEAVGKESIYVIHQLEQVSSDEHVGSLAENALEALRSHERIWKDVEAARRSTREEKKRMAMAMRERQLNTMGMKTNEKGQVTTAVSTILDQMEDLAEETGLICVICREGYKYQPTKVLGIYTFSKRTLVEEYEVKSRKTYGYTTVSHFNVVHVDCHMAAIRLARARDEWESASLQNGNTRANSLVPLWGTQVPESAFAACLARHNAYLQEATGHRDVGFSSGIHDLKLLFLKFAEEKSFHEDTGGGGPESNMHLIPYLCHTALYVLNTTRSTGKESNLVDKFLAAPPTQWKDDSCAAEGTFYWLVVSLLAHHPEKWLNNRIQWLRRIIVGCGIRYKQYKNSSFEQYRSGLIFLALIHGLYTTVFKDVNLSGEWSASLADFIRRNDENLLKSTSVLLNQYQQKMLKAKSIKDLLELIGMSEKPELKDTKAFVLEAWTSIG